MPDRRAVHTLGVLAAGLLLGLVLGALAGLLRAPAPHRGEEADR